MSKISDNKELGIYIHIPFCKKKCDYCDFISYSDKLNLSDKYFETIEKELNSYDFKKYNITTIYIGGGTPSYVDEKYIYNLLSYLKNNLINNKTKFEDIEITIEINPGTVNIEKLELYKKQGVNRISIGLQTTNNKLLKEIGRIHTYEEFIEAYKIIKEVGFENINVDLMIGLPLQTINDVKTSLDEIKKLKPKHVSIYSLIVEEGTIIEKKLNDGILQLPNEEAERQMYWYVKNILENEGYNHYEISNFAKEGYESKHNLNCWEQKEYIGIGVAAHSYINGTRYSNTNILEKYIKQDNNFYNKEELEKKDVRIIEEVQSLEDKKKEHMLLGLRKIKGVKISKFKEKYRENPIYIYKNELEELVEEGLIIIDGDYIRLTDKGLDLANLVWEKFI